MLSTYITIALTLVIIILAVILLKKTLGGPAAALPPSTNSKGVNFDDYVTWESIIKLTDPSSLQADWKNCFNKIRHELSRTFDADDYFLLDRKSPADFLRSQKQSKENTRNQYDWILSIPVWMALLSKGRVIHNSITNFEEQEQQILKEHEIETILLIPVMVNKEFWGIVGVVRRSKTQLFTPQQLNFLRFMTNILAIAVSNHQDRLERDRLVTVVEQSSDCIIIINTSGSIVYANPACLQVTGYAPNEIIGESIKTIYKPKLQKKIWHQIKHPLRKGKGWSGQFTNYRKDDTLYEEEMHISPVHNQNGIVTNQVIVKRNITEAKRLESIAEAANLMDNIGFIFSSIRHELGNPINSIKVSLSVLESNIEGYDTADIKRFVNRSLSDIGRIEYLLKTLKNFSIFERPDVTPTDIQTLLDKLFQLTAKDLKKENITLHISHSPFPIIGLVDPRAFLQVLLNLITNAVAALKDVEDKQITISMGKEEHGPITFSLADNGCGMDESTVKNLFRPFFTTKEEGTGLGLVIVKKMLAKMNCSIEAQSWKDEGTLIQIIIPEP